MVDPITMSVATALRRSELLGLCWTDYDAKVATITVTGKVVRASGEGLAQVNETKNAAGRRTIPVGRRVAAPLPYAMSLSPFPESKR